MLNMTKKLAISSAVTMVFAAWGIQAQAKTANAASANIVITASVTAKTCTPQWTDANIMVDLGKVASSDMASKGDVGALKPFTLSLTDCDAGVTNVDVSSSGEADSVDSAAFANVTSSADNAAQGVAVTLFGGPSQDKQLTPDAKTHVTYPVDAETHAADMMFMAKLESTGDHSAITAGPVRSRATLYMTYE